FPCTSPQVTRSDARSIDTQCRSSAAAPGPGLAAGAGGRSACPAGAAATSAAPIATQIVPIDLVADADAAAMYPTRIAEGGTSSTRGGQRPDEARGLGADERPAGRRCLRLRRTQGGDRAGLPTGGRGSMTLAAVG